MGDERGGSGSGTGVVVGADGSLSALAAVTWAAAEAARRGAELHLLEVLPAAGTAETPAGPPHGRARAQLYRAMGAARAISPTVPVHMATVHGKVGPALVAYADHADLLVVGSNGPGGPIPLSVGRVLAEVTARAACPAVVVPATGTGALASSSRPVLVDAAATSHGERALTFAAETAARWAVPLVLVSAGGRHRSGGANSERISEAVARLRDRHPALTIESLVEDGPAESVLQAGRDAQLVVLGSLRRRAAHSAFPGWSRHFLPLLSPCAVAVVSSRTRAAPLTEMDRPDSDAVPAAAGGRL